MPPLAVILESTVEVHCPQVEIIELRENSEEIGAALVANGYRTEIVPFTLDVESIRARLLALRPEVVFNLVDSIEGKGNLVPIAPLLLEHLQIPFTGAGSVGMTASCHKITAKRMMRGQGILTPDWLEAAQVAAAKKIKTPYIVKSVTEHASYGMDAASVVHDAAALKDKFSEKVEKHGGEWFAEAYIDGREFNLSVIDTPEGPRVLPSAEIVFTEVFPQDAPKIVDYTAKWLYDSPECKGTVRRFDFAAADKKLLRELEKIALACWHIFGLTGYARVDFRVDAAGRPTVLEVNANPFLTAEEGMGAAAARAGIPFHALIGHIVGAALRGQGERTRTLSPAA